MAGIFAGAYNKTAAVQKAVNGFRSCGLWPLNDQIFSEEDFVAAEFTDEPKPDNLSRPEGKRGTGDERAGERGTGEERAEERGTGEGRAGERGTGGGVLRREGLVRTVLRKER